VPPQGGQCEVCRSLLLNKQEAAKNMETIYIPLEQVYSVIALEKPAAKYDPRYTTFGET
jgi:hypothetical protein